MINAEQIAVSNLLRFRSFYESPASNWSDAKERQQDPTALFVLDSGAITNLEESVFGSFVETHEDHALKKTDIQLLLIKLSTATTTGIATATTAGS